MLLLYCVQNVLIVLVECCIYGVFALYEICVKSATKRNSIEEVDGKVINTISIGPLVLCFESIIMLEVRKD